MRTKALLCAAFVAVGLTTAVAQGQNVYSLNIVGYVNVTAQPGYNLLANPLSAGVTNGANEIMPLVDSSIFLTWNGSSFNYASYDSGFGGWIDAAFQASQPPTLPPGRGFFYFNPATTASTITFVGQVVPGPGATNNLTLAPGYSLIGSALPASATDIHAAPVGLPLIDSMIVLQWNGTSYTYSSYDSGFGGWIDAAFQTKTAPAYNVGSGFFFFNPGTVNATWSQVLP